MAVDFLGDYAGTNFFTGGGEGTQPREFEFKHLPHTRLTDEDDENENWPQYVENSHNLVNLVVETDTRHENNYAN
jgi:hypothetical protein